MRLGRTKSWVVAIGAALLVAFGVVPALSGAASAAPTPTSATPSAANVPWAYCGTGWSNSTITIGNSTLVYHSEFGWCVIWKATPTGPNTTMLEVQRTVGVTISATFTNPYETIQLQHHAQDVDTAFANVTNASTVNVGDLSVPALGLINASASENASISQSVSQTVHGQTRSGSLNIQGVGQGAVSFTPALGLIPLNLSGINMWNSSATASAAAAWNVSWAWDFTGFNGTTASGSMYHQGNLSWTGMVYLTGYKVPIEGMFDDHQARVGVLLILSGPFDLRDGFILVAHDFDLFGDAAQGFDNMQMGSVSMGSGEALDVSQGPNGPRVTAANQAFASDDTTATSGMYGGGMTPGATSGPSSTVQAQPVSVAQAQSEDHALTSAPTVNPGSQTSGLWLGVLVAAVVVGVGALGVVGRRRPARRQRKGSEPVQDPTRQS